MDDNVNYISSQILNGSYTLAGKRKGRSFIWNILCEVIKPDGTSIPGIVCCRICQMVLKFASNQTSNLSRHRCCKTIKETGELDKPVAEADKSEAIDKFTAWAIEDGLPFSTVDGPGFVKLAKFLIKIGANYGEHVNMDDLLPDPTIIYRKAKRHADKKKEYLKNAINDAVRSGGASATINMWTDNYVKRNFLGVTFHYQKDCELIEIVLGLKSMDFERSTSSNIMKKLYSLFNQFDVHDIDLIKFITDQETNIVKALGHNTRLNCSTRLFSDVLDKSFAETKQMKDIYESCKSVIKYFKTANFQLLSVGPKSQSPTLWNSYYSMLKTVADNWIRMNSDLTDNKQNLLLSNINISIITELVDLCRYFEVVFKKLQNCNSPSLCYVLPSVLKIKALCEPKDGNITALSVLKEKIQLNIDEIWLANLGVWHKVACFLYPPAINMQPNDLVEIKDFCSTRIKDIASTISTKNEASRPNTPSSTHSEQSFLASISDNSLSFNNDASFFFSHLVDHSDSKCIIIPDEVERYSREIVPMTENFSLIQWWKVNQEKYPHLSTLAFQIHSMPASIAAFERFSSMAGLIISEKQKRLGSGSADSLLFLNTYYKNFDA